MAPYVWVEQIERDLEAGAWKVIAEARESGTAGIYRADGEVRSGLIDEIAHAVDPERMIFEAPLQVSAGVAARLLRLRVQPRQHRPGRRALAGDAAGWGCARTPWSASRWAGRISRDELRPTRGLRWRGVRAWSRQGRLSSWRAWCSGCWWWPVSRVRGDAAAQAHPDAGAGIQDGRSLSPDPRTRPRPAAGGCRHGW